MAQIFYVHCPACGGKFPCHPELWQAEYDLLCPFCGHTFPQEASPLIITGTGEQRPGRGVGLSRPPGRATESAAAAPPRVSASADTPAHAESM